MRTRLVVALLMGVVSLALVGSAGAKSGGSTSAQAGRGAATASSSHTEQAQSPSTNGGPRTGECEDGIDNDNDGLTDADDPACQQPGCLPSSQTPQKCEEHTVNPPPPVGRAHAAEALRFFVM